MPCLFILSLHTFKHNNRSRIKRAMSEQRAKQIVARGNEQDAACHLGSATNATNASDGTWLFATDSASQISQEQTKEREKGLASCSKEDSEPLCHSSALQSHMQCNKGSIIGPPLLNCSYNSPEGTERAVDARIDK